MRTALVLWLNAHHLPGWLAPDYVVMVALAGIVGTMITLWLAKRDGADGALQRRALIATYVGALCGGYVLEWLRVLPEALLHLSFTPFIHTGRAAYGGLLMGILAAALVLRRAKADVLPFLDRGVPLAGLSFGFVRVGCFLGGCDYGKVTAGPLGVRFPEHSAASIDHAARGWIPHGAPSLPVHPTQLYEALLGVMAACVASFWLRRKERDGKAFTTWLALYAIGRFFLEMLRGDESRGMYGPLSTAQVISLGLLAVVLLFHVRRSARWAMASTASVLALLVFPSTASAQLQIAGPAPNPPVRRPDRPSALRGLHFSAGLLGAGYLVPGRWDISNGGNAALEMMLWLPGDEQQHFEVGFEGRYVGTSQAHQIGGGITGRWMARIHTNGQTELSLTPFISHIMFSSPIFEEANAFGISMRIGYGYQVVPALTVGINPFTLTFMGSGDVKPIWSYEPGVWIRAKVF